MSVRKNWCHTSQTKVKPMSDRLFVVVEMVF